MKKTGLHLENLNPLDGTAWQETLETFPDHSVFHTSEWAKVLSASYGHQPSYLRFLRDGNLVGAIPLMQVKSAITGIRGVSVPFSDYAGILEKDPSLTDQILDPLNSFSKLKNWNYIELRSQAQISIGDLPSYKGHLLDLKFPVDELYRKLSNSVKRNIRKGENGEVEVNVKKDLASMLQFYGLHCLTRRRHGLPPQPFSFFKNLFREMIEKGLGVIVLAFLSGRAIGGAVFLHTGRHAVYKYGASDDKYWPHRPNHLIMWAAIRHLQCIGQWTLHFGRTDLGDSGLIQFKRSWGSTESDIFYHRIPSERSAPARANRAKTHSGSFLFRKSPILLNQAAGWMLYPHLD